MKPHLHLIFLWTVSFQAGVLPSCLADEVVTASLPPAHPRIDNSFNRRPLAFEQNVGQVDSEVQFLARGRGYQLLLTGTEAVMVLNSQSADAGAFGPSAKTLKTPEDWRTQRPGGDRAVSLDSSAVLHGPRVLRMQLAGGSLPTSVVGEQELPGKVNYFIGNDPSRWRTNISTYSRVLYRDVYPGTDLVYYGNEGRLEYDFIVRPGADPGLIALKLDGADRVELDAQGDLVAWAAGRTVHWQKPVVYQEVGGERHPIAGRYRLEGGVLTAESGTSKRIGFELAAYDRTRPLVIDPVLVYSTFLGGSGWDSAVGLATDSQGNVYLAGMTGSWDFPMKEAIQPGSAGEGDVFVTKISPAGTLLYSTYLGGTSGDQPAALAVDGQGNAHVAGGTFSTDFPLVNPLQPGPGGDTDAFVTILNSSGSAIICSTYLGGTSEQGAHAIALDPAGNIYLCGATGRDFPLVKALQPQFGGWEDAFITKLAPGGKAILYSTYFGGTSLDCVWAVAADAQGNAYVSGSTESRNMPMKNARQTKYTCRFYAKILPDGSDVVYSSYGELGNDYGTLALGPEGALWLVGGTDVRGVATPGAFQTNFSGGLIERLNAADGSLVAATYVDGCKPSSVVADARGDVWIGAAVGELKGQLPLVDPIQPNYGGGSADGFVARFSSDLSTLRFSTYLGGSDYDYIGGLAFDPHGDLAVVGGTLSGDFPTLDPFQSVSAGDMEVFVAKIRVAEVLTVSRSGQSLTLSWRASTTAYQLESAGNLGVGATWETVNTQPVVNGDDQAVTVPIEAGARFFRLRKL